MNNQTLVTKLNEIKRIADECLADLSGVHPQHHEQVSKKGNPKDSPKDTDISNSSDLTLPIVNKIADCDENEKIQSEVLDQKNMEAKILLCFFISQKYFDNTWLTTGDVEKITSGLGTKITAGNVSNKITGGTRQYLESGAVRKKGQPTPYRLNRKGTKYFESLLNPNEKE